MGYKKVLGSRNPADALTKYMPSTLMDQHVETVGLEIRGGRADSAPGLDNVEPYTEMNKMKKVRFHAVICVRHIPSVGRCVSLREVKKTKWAGKVARRSAEDGADAEVRRPVGQQREEGGEDRIGPICQ